MVKCILCQRDAVKYIDSIESPYNWLYGERKFSIYDCQTCDTRFAYPFESSNPNFYDFVFDQTDIYQSSLEFARTLRRQEDASWALIARGNPYFAVFEYLKGKRGLLALDVGCGYGSMVYVLNMMGHRAFGIDVSRQSVYVAAGLYGGIFANETVATHAQNNPGKYDLLYAIEVFEHLDKPWEFIRDCLACLKPGGDLIISTPNRDYKTYDSSRSGYAGQWPGEKPPLHLGFYGERAMAYIANEYKLGLRFPTFPGLMEFTGPLNLVAIFTKQ